MSLLDNALKSIALGVEDYTSPDERRILSCVRNLHSGILLLFKHKLQILSPKGSADVLLMEKQLPYRTANGEISWKGAGKRTVGTLGIKTRFKELGIVVDWRRIQTIADYRNDVEHFFSPETPQAARTYISNVFVVVRDFIRTHLGLDPSELLDEETYRVLVEETEVHAKEFLECQASMDSIGWSSDLLQEMAKQAACSECRSDLLEARSVGGAAPIFKCRSCRAERTYDTFAEEAVIQFCGPSNRLEVPDGGEPANIECPECGRATYLLDEDICVLCGCSVERTCRNCALPIPASELEDDGLCGWCRHMDRKDD